MPFSMEMLAYCGLYCDQCSARVAYAEQDLKHVEQYPAKHIRERLNLSNSDCEGCKGRNICGPCAIKDCAVQKAINSCAECGDFPCALLDTFENDGLPHHRQAVENLRNIRENGAEAWFRKLLPTLRCHCGERQSWYYSCPKHS